MAEDDKKELEQAFRTRNEALRAFYDSGSDAVVGDEAESLTPIFNSLTQHKNRYSEIRLIAEGGEKKVTLVHDHLLDRRVAMARSAHANKPAEYEQFLREARLTANLGHPNIMSIHNIGLDVDGVPFFSMELVTGDSLKNIVDRLRSGDETYRKHYPAALLLNIFIKVCDAVAYAHSRHVLHLDLKPDNIRVGPFGEVFVCDWGLARVLSTVEQENTDESLMLDGDVLNDMTLSGLMKGTPGFMAPEQTVSGGEKTVQTDIYALGVLLYMLLTHELPVRGASANELIQSTREGNIVHPRSYRVPKGLVAVMLKALALRPADRYASVLELRQEIDRHLAGYPTRAEHAGPVEHLVLLIQRHSRVTFMLMFFFMLLAAVISMYLLAISREKAEAVAARETAEQNFQLYKQQQQVSQELGKNLGEAVLYTVKSRDYINAPAMIQVLEMGLKENVGTVQRQNLLEHKGVLHFVLQEFNAAADCFKEAGSLQGTRQTLELCLKYAELKPSDAQRLNDSQLAALINEAQFVNRMTVYYLYHHHMRRRPANATPEEYLPLAGAMLDKLNYTRYAQENGLKLTSEGDGYRLDLSNSPYAIFSLNILGVYHRNLLQPLNLKALDVSSSKLSDPTELRGLLLDELRMAGCSISDEKVLLRQLVSVRTRRVILSEADYPSDMIAELRTIMEVADAPSE